MFTVLDNYLFALFLEEFIPYHVAVRSANLRGCGEAEAKVCFTREGGNSLYCMYTCYTYNVMNIHHC